MAQVEEAIKQGVHPSGSKPGIFHPMQSLQEVARETLREMTPEDIFRHRVETFLDKRNSESVREKAREKLKADWDTPEYKAVRESIHGSTKIVDEAIKEWQTEYKKREPGWRAQSTENARSATARGNAWTDQNRLMSGFPETAYAGRVIAETGHHYKPQEQSDFDAARYFLDHARYYQNTYSELENAIYAQPSKEMGFMEKAYRYTTLPGLANALFTKDKSGKSRFDQFLHGIAPRNVEDAVSFGWAETVHLSRLNSINAKAARGEELTDGEKAMAGAYLVSLDAQAGLQMFGGATTAEKFGQFIGENVPFLIEMAVSGGLGGAAAGAVRGLARKGIVKGIQMAGKSGAKGLAGAALKSGAGRYVAKQGANIASSLVGGAAMAPFSQTTYRNYTQRENDQYDVGLDAEGNYTARLARPTSEWERGWKSYVGAGVELGSEFWGTFAGAGRIFPRWMQKTKVGEVLEPIRKFTQTPGGRRFDNYVGDVFKWNGGTMEGLEEEFSNALEPILTGETERLKANFSPEAQFDTILGVVAMSTAMGAVRTPIVAFDHARHARTGAKLRSQISDPTLRESLQQIMASGTRQEQAQKLGQIDWSTVSMQDRAAAMDYVAHRVEGRVTQDMQEAMRKQAATAEAQRRFEQHKNRDTGNIETVTDSEGNSFYLASGTLETDEKTTAGPTTEQKDVPPTGRPMTAEEAGAFVERMQHGAQPAPELELTIENWDREFGPEGTVETPIGTVKMGEHQFAKLSRQGRNGKLGMVKPTLTDPDIIVEDASKAAPGQQTERPSSYVFVKTFSGENGERIYHFTSVTVSRDGQEVVISNQEKSPERIERLMKEGVPTYIKKATLPSESVTSAQGDRQSIPDGATLFNKGTKSARGNKRNPAVTDGTVFVIDPATGQTSQRSVEELKRGETTTPEQYETGFRQQLETISQAEAEEADMQEIIEKANAEGEDPMPRMAEYKGIDLNTLAGQTVTLADGSQAYINQVYTNRNGFVEIDAVPVDPSTGQLLTNENGEEAHYLLDVRSIVAPKQQEQTRGNAQEATPAVPEQSPVQEAQAEEQPIEATAETVPQEENPIQGSDQTISQPDPYADIQPVGKGLFGNIYLQFRGKAQEAIDFLLHRKEGEAVGALHHPQVGDIDLVWGKEGTAHSDGYGLSKIAKYHPEVLTNLQEIISGMDITKASGNRLQLESRSHTASIRLDWNGEKKTWLLTAFEKETPTPLDRTTDVGENLRDLQNDTAPLQSDGVSKRSISLQEETSQDKTTIFGPNVQEAEQNIPRKKDGTPDYDQIEDPATVASALNEEFGEEAAEVARESLDEAREALEQADNIRKAIDRRRARLKAQNEVAKWEAVCDALAPTRETETAEQTAETQDVPSVTLDPVMGDLITEEMHRRAPGTITVREQSDPKANNNFIQRYDIDGKPSGVYGIYDIETDINTEPVSFGLDEFSWRAENWDELEQMYNAYKADRPEVRSWIDDEGGAQFRDINDALEFKRFVDTHAQRKGAAKGVEQSTDIPFLRSEIGNTEPASNFSQEHRAQVEEIVRELDRASGIQAVVFSTLDELPEKVRRAIEASDPNHEYAPPKGFYLFGEVYINASEIVDLGEVERVYHHEVGGHQAVERSGLTDAELQALYRQTADEIGTDHMRAQNIPELDEVVDAYLAGEITAMQLGREYIAYSTERFFSPALYNNTTEPVFSVDLSQPVTDATIKRIIESANRKHDGKPNLTLAASDPRRAGLHDTTPLSDHRGREFLHAPVYGSNGRPQGNETSSGTGDGTGRGVETGDPEHSRAVSEQDAARADRTESGALPAGETVADDIRYRRG
ncbi:PBECR2 nuclease fold domain-containing protein, partial [uncultured Rikenella sp.]